MLKTNISLFHKVIACFWIFCMTFLSFGVVSSHMGNLRQIDGQIGLLRVDAGEGVKWLAKKSYQALIGNIEAQAQLAVVDPVAEKGRIFEQLLNKLLNQFITSITQFVQQKLSQLRSSVLEITQSWAATNTQLSKVQGIAEKLLALQNSRSFQCGSAGVLNGLIQNFFPQASFDFCSTDVGNTQITGSDTSASAMAKGLTAFFDAGSMEAAGPGSSAPQSNSGTAATAAPVSTQEIAANITNIAKEEKRNTTNNCPTGDWMFDYMTQATGCMGSDIEIGAAFTDTLEKKLQEVKGSTTTALNTANSGGEATLAIAETGNDSSNSTDSKKSNGLLSATGDNSSVEIGGKKFQTVKFKTYDNQTEGLKKAFDLTNAPAIPSLSSGSEGMANVFSQFLSTLFDTLKTLVANAVGDIMKSVMASLAPFTNAVSGLSPLFNLAFGTEANAADLSKLENSGQTATQNIDQAKKNIEFNFNEMCQAYYADERAKYADLIVQIPDLPDRCGGELRDELAKDFDTSVCREYVLPQQNDPYNKARDEFGPIENLQAECQERGRSFSFRLEQTQENQIATENN